MSMTRQARQTILSMLRSNLLLDMAIFISLVTPEFSSGITTSRIETFSKVVLRSKDV